MRKSPRFILCGSITTEFKVISRPCCPQNYVNVGYLLRIPESLDEGSEIAQDELKCLNINVTSPATIAAGKLLPVLVWIHGMKETSRASVRCGLTVENRWFAGR